MINKSDVLYSDLEAVKNIAIAPLMLEVICRATGMGFAAIARVTEDRWLACSVRDEVCFGLEEGGELKIETTICNEIRDSKRPVVIDHVDKSDIYRNHHTPSIYGLQSYISFPIVLKNGRFFGTLCAIDTRPAEIDNTKITGMFQLFAELIAFHLESVELLNRSHSLIQEKDRQLQYASGENFQYHQISSHHFQEPIRKISLFSQILLRDVELNESEKIKAGATKIDTLARQATDMLRHVSEFSGLNYDNSAIEQVDFNQVIADVLPLLGDRLEKASMSISWDNLPVIFANSKQMGQLFYHLLGHILTFSKDSIASTTKIFSKDVAPDWVKEVLPDVNKFDYCEILLEVNCVAIDTYKMENIFDIFLHLDSSHLSAKYGAGLAYCQKIVHNHRGLITAKKTAQDVTLISIVLPLQN